MTGHSRQRAVINAKIDGAVDNLDRSVKDIKQAVVASGYRDSYRTVVQSYPSPLPRAPEIRCGETGAVDNSRSCQGCPMCDPDLDRTRDSLVPVLSFRISQVARPSKVAFIDLSDAFQGHETRSTSTRVADAKNRPSSATSDWSRYFNYPGEQLTYVPDGCQDTEMAV